MYERIRKYGCVLRVLTMQDDRKLREYDEAFQNAINTVGDNFSLLRSVHNVISVEERKWKGMFNKLLTIAERGAASIYQIPWLSPYITTLITKRAQVHSKMEFLESVILSIRCKEYLVAGGYYQCLAIDELCKGGEFECHKILSELAVLPSSKQNDQESKLKNKLTTTKVPHTLPEIRGDRDYKSANDLDVILNDAKYVQ